MAIWLQNCGAAYARKKVFDIALADLNHAVEIDPTVPESYVNRAYILNTKGDSDAALVDLTHSIQLNPKGADAYGIRCTVYAGRGEYDRAIGDCDREVELAPKSEAGRSVPAPRPDLLKTGKFDLARTNLDKALELNPNYPEAKANLAELEKAEAAAKATPVEQASAEPAADGNGPRPTAPFVSTPSAVPLGKRVALVVGNSPIKTSRGSTIR